MLYLSLSLPPLPCLYYYVSQSPRRQRVFFPVQRRGECRCWAQCGSFPTSLALDTCSGRTVTGHTYFMFLRLHSRRNFSAGAKPWRKLSGPWRPKRLRGPRGPRLTRSPRPASPSRRPPRRTRRRSSVASPRRSEEGKEPVAYVHNQSVILFKFFFFLFVFPFGITGFFSSCVFFKQIYISYFAKISRNIVV